VGKDLQESQFKTAFLQYSRKYMVFDSISIILTVTAYVNGVYVTVITTVKTVRLYPIRA